MSLQIFFSIFADESDKLMNNRICRQMLDKKRIVFIVNPKSGVQGKKFIVAQIEKNIDKNLFDYEVTFTRRQGHATEIARKAAEEGVDIVCAVGGDGTVNETASALVHTSTALAIIPSGSGNGLARHLHVPIESDKAIELINTLSIRQIDYGIVNDLPFFCTCGVGFDAYISHKFSEAGKRGVLTYIENVIATALKYVPETYELEIYNGDSVKHSVVKAFLISCANASQYGNNAYIAPQASVCDGLMDVTIITPFNVAEAPIIAMQLFNGNIDKNVRIDSFKCERLVIRRVAEGVMHCDGEPLKTDAVVDTRIVPHALHCVCPLEEGVRELAENIQAMIVEQFSDLMKRSELLMKEQAAIWQSKRPALRLADIKKKAQLNRKEK